MATPINLFTQKPYPPEFADLSYNTTIPLTSVDLPYFCILSFRGLLPSIPLADDEITVDMDTFADISDGGWAVVDVSGSKIKTQEFEFLERMALGIQVGDDYYVSKFAYLLYDVSDGLFSNFDSTDTAEEKKAWLTPLMRLILTYLLPGLWWETFYARQYLPDSIGETTRLNANMLEIERELKEIDTIFGLPKVEDDDAEPPAES
jgi:hypothetical protein